MLKPNQKISLLLGLIVLSTAIQAQFIHLSEDFNAGTLPTGWNTTAVTGSIAWSVGLDGSSDHAGNNNLNGTGIAYFDDSQLGLGALNNKAEIISPVFDNSANSATYLDFDYNFREYIPAPDSFLVDVFDGTNWNRVFSRNTNDCGSINSVAANPCFGNFPHASIDISAFKNANCRVRFTYFDGNDWGWYVALDNVVLSSPLADDIGISRITGPESSCGMGLDTVKVMILNYGANAASGFPVSYVINNGTAVTENVTASIPSNDSLEFKFATPANFSTVGVYSVDAYTSYTLDGASTNDSASTVVENEPSYVPDYFEGFESGLAGWSIRGNNASWAHGIPNTTNIPSAAGGTKAIVTNLAGTYNSNENAVLTSPCFDFSSLTADPEVRFSINYLTESPFDRAWLEVSTDEGITWTKVNGVAGSNNWYNNAVSHVWTGNSNGWVMAKTKLTGLAGQAKVLLRFRFTSNASANLDGVGIDNFAVKTKQANDLEVLSLDIPSQIPECGLSSTEFITMTIRNDGINPISTFDAGYSINGNTPIIQNNISLANAIPSGGIYQFTFSSSANLSGLGNHVLTLWASASGDGFLFNDTLGNQILQNVSTALFTSLNEDFNSFSAGTILHNINDNLNNGWTRFPDPSSFSGQYMWRVADSNLLLRNPHIGPLTDVSSLGNFLYTEASYGAPNNIAALISPCIDLRAYAGAELSFWWLRYSVQNGPLYIDVYDGTNWVNNILIVNGRSTNRTDWTNQIFNISAFAGKRIKIRFTAIRTASSNADMAIDEVQIFPRFPKDAEPLRILSPDSCGFTTNTELRVKLFNRGVNSILQDSMLVFYQIDNLPPVADTFRSVILPDDSMLFQFSVGPNLSVLGRSYSIKVWTNLFGDQNLANDTIIDTLTNYESALPFFEDFESYNFQSNSGEWTFNPNLNPPSFGTYWYLYSGYSPYWYAGPAKDHTTGLGNYMALGTSNSNPLKYGSIISPCLDLTNYNSIGFDFWYHKFGSSMGDLIVDIYDQNLGTWDTNFQVIPGQTNISRASPWMQSKLNLSAYAGKNVRIRFRGEDSLAFHAFSNMAIDDILLYELLAADVQVHNIISPTASCGLSTNTSTTIELVNFGSAAIQANSVQVFYQLDNLAPVMESVSASIPIGGSIQHTFSIGPNLSASNQTYNLKVWSQLSGDSNQFNDTINLSIHNKIESIPYFENFETFSGQSNSRGWTFGPNTPTHWTTTTGFTPTGQTGPLGDHTSGSGVYAHLEASNAGGPATLLSPCIDLSGLNNAGLSFWYHKYGSEMQDLVLDIYDAATATWVDSFYTIYGRTHFSQNALWLEAKVDLSSFIGKQISIRFRGFDGPPNHPQGTNDMAIDDFLIMDSNLVSLEETQSMSHFMLYPNPANSQIIINISNKLKMKQISIKDLKGRIVYTSQGFGSKFKIDLSHLVSGVYFVQVRTESGMQTKKLILTE